MAGLRSPTNRENGSTLMEAVAAITIISILGMVLWTSFSTASGGVAGGMLRLMRGRNLISVRMLLEREAGRIRVPFWIGKNPGFMENDTELLLPYLDGEEKSQLSVRFEGGTLFVENGTDKKMLRTGEPILLSILKDQETGTQLGIKVEFSSGDMICVPFGSCAQ